jgi:hypothetical protein
MMADSSFDSYLDINNLHYGDYFKVTALYHAAKVLLDVIP